MKNSIVRTNHNPASVWNGFDPIFDSFWGRPLLSAQQSPAVDVRETAKNYLIEAELPGLTEKDIAISVEDNLLVIESTKGDEAEQNDTNWLLRERRAYQFRRSFALPKDVDYDGVTATFKDGLLTLEVPKSAKAQPRQITVKKI